MTIRSLKIFVEVAESGKISDTARKLYITQASVSQCISEIEKEYNIRLFERLSKKLYLTPSGKQLLEYGRQLLAYNKMVDDFLLQSTRGKILRVGASLSTGASILSDLITLMEQKHPDVKNQIVVARNSIIEEKLLDNDLDICLNDVQPSSNDLICSPIMRDTLVLICSRSHPLCGRKNIMLKDLAGENLIVRDNTNNASTRLEQLLSERGIPYNVSWVCADTLASKKAVCSGHGISTISQRLIRDEVEQGLLWPLEVLDANMDRTFNLLYHKDKYLTDYMNDFIQLAKNYENLSAS